MKAAIALFASTLVWLALTASSPWLELPKCLQGNFQGITETSETGELIGHVDRDDWGCVGTQASSVLPPREGAAADVPVPPPVPGICVPPPSPNPSRGHVRLRLTVGETEDIRIEIYSQPKGAGPHHVELVNTLFDGTMRAGAYEILWDGSFTSGQPSKDGIYRVVVTAGDRTICGDVQLQ